MKKLYFYNSHEKDCDPAKEKKKAQALGAIARDAAAHNSGDYIEKCDQILGSPPKSYVDKYGEPEAANSGNMDHLKIIESLRADLNEAIAENAELQHALSECRELLDQITSNNETKESEEIEDKDGAKAQGDLIESAPKRRGRPPKTAE